MARRRSYVQRQLRSEFRRFLKVWRKDLIHVALTIALVCLVEAVLPTPAWLRGFVVGFLITATAALVALVFLLSGGALLLAGAMGEGHTTEELEAARKGGLIWSWVPNVEASNRDVDHLVLTPSGVIAAETKWRFRDANAVWLAEAVTKAESAARQARLVLQSMGIDYRTEVRPVVIVWGGARRELPPEQAINGVNVVRGDHLVAWLQGAARGHLAEDHAELLYAKVAAFVDSHQPASA